MMVTFTKLFATNIVASVRSLSLRSLSIPKSFGFFSVSISLRSEGVRLKNAISEPLAKAEAPNKTTASKEAITTPNVGVLKETSSKACCKNDISNFTKI